MIPNLTAVFADLAARILPAAPRPARPDFLFDLADPQEKRSRNRTWSRPWTVDRRAFPGQSS